MDAHTVDDNTVAIVGMSCRFAPDLDTPEKFWDFLTSGSTSVREMPQKRWAPYAAANPQATAAVRATTLLGAYLDDIDGFDADFFQITPKEAEYLDPQQRFMLELTWEALCDAGIAPTSLAGSDAGVYAAVNSTDYGRRVLEDLARTGAYAVNGTTDYGIANRVSYFLDVHGPSMAVNTACAASLTALHVAAHALRTHEVPVAIVGGMNIISTPALNVALQGAGALAPDGRSKAFDEAADGYGRGEGAGVVVLKRYADAVADGDRVLALIRGSGVFQDGRSDGMMAPNDAAQEHMLRTVYRRAGVDPSTVDYVEAHGTGTPTGDATELRALARVFGENRPSGAECLIGSAKPNVGHVEGGSGLVGLIKIILSLRAESIPPSLLTAPTSGIDWPTSGLRLVREAVPWPGGEGIRRAGLSNYGVGGTIAHLIVEEAPQDVAVPMPAPASPGPVAVPLSSASQAGVKALAAVVADYAGDNPAVPLRDLAHTLARRRAHLPYRLAVTAETSEELRHRLRAVAAGETGPDLAIGERGHTAARQPVWVFSGHGAQWPGMARDLIDHDKDFTRELDALGEVFRAELGWTPRQALLEREEWSAAEVQVLTVATQIALAGAWRGRGVTPGAVIGHSVGEIAAAVTAGVLDKHAAVAFACRRALALERIAGQGAMVMAALSAEECRQRLGAVVDPEIAIHASPFSTVLSGSPERVQAITEAWVREGVQMRAIASDIAFHSVQTRRLAEEVGRAAAELTPREPLVPLYSTALAHPRSDAPRDGGYWAANLTDPVRFEEAVSAALEDGHRLFLEIATHPVVSHSLLECAIAAGVEDEVVVVGSLRRDTPDRLALARGLCALHAAGAEIDWEDALGYEGTLVNVPGMAWQHRDYWLFDDGGADAGLGAGHDPDSHSLLGGRMTVAGTPTRHIWQTRLDMDSRPYPLSHALVGVEVTPAASLLNSFVEAADAREGATLVDIALRTPLAVEPSRIVQVVREGNTISLASRLDQDSAGDSGTEWITHCSATIDVLAPAPAGRIDLATARTSLEPWPEEEVHEMFRQAGVGGYAFPWDLADLRRDQDSQLAVMDLPGPDSQKRSWAHVIDAALTISAALVTPTDAEGLWMSQSINKVAIAGDPPSRITVMSRRSAGTSAASVDVLIGDATGEVVAEVRGLAFSAVDTVGLATSPKDLVFESRWEQSDSSPKGADLTGRRILLIGAGEVQEALVRVLGTAGGVVSTAPRADQADVRAGADEVVLVLGAPGTADIPAAAAYNTWELVAATQAVLAAQASAGSTGPRLWVVTTGVKQLVRADALSHAAAWGSARIIAGEHPQLWGATLDLDSPTDAAVEQLAALLAGATPDEDVVNLAADGTLWVERFGPVDRPVDKEPLVCTASGTILITGGLGELGLEAARWLAGRGARRLILAGRRGLPPRSTWAAAQPETVRGQIAAVLELEAMGVSVHILPLDVSDAEAVRRAVGPGQSDLPPITGVVHAAGMVADDLVDNLPRSAVTTVFGPKAEGAWTLHELFPPGTLDFFILFSSCGQLARLSGQSAYAAGNSFLDALAKVRHAQGDRGSVSLAWTSWRGRGLSRDLTTTMLEANTRGLEAVSTDEALRAWTFSDNFASPYYAVMRVLPSQPGLPRPPALRDLVTTEMDADASAATLYEVDWDLPPQESLAALTGRVREEVAAELHADTENLDIRRPLVEMGVDSVMAVALRVRLTRSFGLDFPPTILWAKPTVAELAADIHDRLRPDENDCPLPQPDSAVFA